MGVWVFHLRKVLGWGFVLRFAGVDRASIIEEIKLFFLPIGPYAGQREARAAGFSAPRSPRLQWNRGGSGDSVLTFRSRVALAAAIFFAHSVSLMGDAC